MASITGCKAGGDRRAGSARLVCRRTWAAALATLDQGFVRLWDGFGEGLRQDASERADVRVQPRQGAGQRLRIGLLGQVRAPLPSRFLGERLKLAQAHADLRR